VELDVALGSVEIASLSLNRVGKSSPSMYTSTVRFSRGEEAVDSFFIFGEALSAVVDPVFGVDVMTGADIRRTGAGFVFEVRLRRRVGGVRLRRRIGGCI
jgi:hypothetical protein